MTGTHAPAAPSGAPVWGNCSGAIMAQSDVPNPDTEPSRRGSANHWGNEEILRSYVDPDRSIMLPSDLLHKQAPNGVVLGEDAVDAAESMTRDVLDVCQTHGCLSSLLIEQWVDMPQIHALNSGTLDAGVFIPEKKLLFNWDYKNGNVDKSPVENLQMIDYVRGLANHYGINGLDEQSITVIMRIVQPFSYHPRGPVKEWVVNLADLRPYWNQLQYKAEEAFTTPKLTTGPWCKDCKAVGKCAATRKAQYNYIELVNQPYEMDAMTTADLAIEKQILEGGLDVGKKRLKAIDATMQHRIGDGDKSSGFTLETSGGKLRWRDDVAPATAKAVCAQLGVDVGKEAVLTPTQSINKAPAAVRPMVKEALKAFTKRSAGALKLTEVSESRTARAFQRRK